jgi:cobalt/nickel transport system ATP-binding protein
MSIIIASHDVEMVTQFAEKIFVLHDGEIIGQGTSYEIFNNYEILQRAHLRPPKAAELLYLLKNDGIDVEVKLTVNEAFHEILHAIGVDAYHNLLHLVKNQLHHELLHILGEEKYHELLHVLEKNKRNNSLMKYDLRRT